MHRKQAQDTWEPTLMPGLRSNVVPFRRISTEEMADQLTYDLRVITERIREYESDLAALKRLQATKADSLEICLRVIGKGVTPHG